MEETRKGGEHSAALAKIASAPADRVSASFLIELARDALRKGETMTTEAKYVAKIDRMDAHSCRYVEIEAPGIKSAYSHAEAICEPNEFVNGVVHVAEFAGTDHEETGQ